MDKDHEVDIDQTSYGPFFLAGEVLLPKRFCMTLQKLGPAIRVTIGRLGSNSLSKQNVLHRLPRDFVTQPDRVTHAHIAIECDVRTREVLSVPKFEPVTHDRQETERDGSFANPCSL